MLGLLIVASHCLVSIYGHGYLFEPVARSSAWLVDPTFRDCCSYANHMEMFCGGIGQQWNVNGGKCAVCGEAFDKPVKLFERGGAMYKGTVVKTYVQGQQIDVKVVLTANHKGFFEFRLCNLDANPWADATQECLDRQLLTIANTGSTQFRDVHLYGSEMITVRVQLPYNVACRQCVFQWKYTAANAWGTDANTGQSGPGLGKENETFLGCSDISILPNGSPTNPPPMISTTRSTTTVRTTTTQRSSMSSASTTARPSSGATSWSADLIDYQTGDEVTYDGVRYRCVSPHRSFPGAEPGVFTWAWWQAI